MAEPTRIAAVDLGAGSGRVVVGHLDAGRVELEVVHRFDNHPVWLPDGLHWDLLGLFAETLRGLALAAAAGPLASIGVDAWGCDYALLDGEFRMLGLPYHYRDTRTSKEVVGRVHATVPRSELYRRTGIQTLPINTVFQLAAEADGPAAAGADRIALIPDLLNLWLTGNLANELTAASTTGLLDAASGAWSHDLVQRLGLPVRPFKGGLVAPGFPVGRVLAGHEAAGTATNVPVHAVAGHDTASAFAATPLEGPGSAVLSSGTWSLLGVELLEPKVSPQAEQANLTNERGVGGTYRLLRNVMGLWLVQECRRAWARAGRQQDLTALIDLARRAPAAPLFDPDDASLLLPGGDMPQRITALCTAAGQPAPRDPGEIVRSILVSLACKYRFVLEQLESVAGRRIEVIHIVGGGAQNDLLCELTAGLCGREVLAGPVEATALGNVLVQALALGVLGDLGELRRMAARSAAVRRYSPGEAEPGDTYQRFLEVTGLSPAPKATSPAHRARMEEVSPR